MKCFRCRKDLDESGNCSCGFSLFTKKSIFPCTLPDRFLKEIQTFFASQGTLLDAELLQLSGSQLYELASKIMEMPESTADYKLATVYYRLAAEKNHAEAQFCLGTCYEHGIGVTRNHAEAMKWYELAARQQIPDAQFRLGWLYRNGRDVKRDDKKAVEWLERAAYAGVVEAQYLLGWMYRNASGVAKDTFEAAKWMRLASEQGHPAAMRAYQNMSAYDNRT